MTTIDLDPDRLLPAEPSQRDVARRLYEGVRGLPIVSPHGHVDPLLLLENAPFDNPAALFVTPDHYVTRMLHAQGVPLDELGIPRRGGEGGVAEPREVWRRALRALGRVPWDPLPLLDRGRAGRGLRGPDPALGGRRRPASTIGWSSASRFPSSARGLSSSASGSRSWPPPTTPAATSPPTAASPRTPPGAAGWCPPSGPTPTSTRRCRAGPAAWTSSDVPPASTPGATPATSRRWRTGAPTSGSTGRPPPTTGRPTPSPCCSARAGRAQLFAPGPAGQRRPPTSCGRSGGHMLCEMARMSCDDGLVMQLHPGVLRNHHPPTLRDFGTDRGADIPVAIEFTRALRPLLERYGDAPQLPDRPLHPRRDHLVPRAGAARRLLPVRLPRRAVVVPRHPRRHAPFPRGGHRHRRLRQDQRLRRRHPRLLLDPGAPRHGATGRLRLPEPAGGRAPAGRGGGRRDRRATSPTGCPAGSSGFDPPLPRELAGGRAAASGPRRPPRAGRLPPLAPGLVHGARRRPRRVGDRRVHRAQPRDRVAAPGAGGPLHAGGAGPGARPPRGGRQHQRRPRR